MNITNTLVITIPVIVEPIVEEVVEPTVEEVIEPTVEEVIEPTSYATVYWTLVDGAWTYMDTYYYDEAGWNSTTPADLQDRQVTQYVAWREYCQSPVTDISDITSTTIEEVI